MPESNVATLQVNSVTEIQNPDSSILFDVDIMPLDAVLGASPDASFITTQGLQAVVASADDAPGVHDVIAVHKPSYRLVKNRDAIEAVEKSLRVSQLDLRDVQVVDQAAYGGCYMRREYTLPKHSVFIGAEDKVAMKVIVENSYNGTSRFNVHIGAFRYVCSNGLVLGESAFTSNRRHTGQIDLEGMVADMANAIPIFLSETAKWKEWAETPLSDDMAHTLFEELQDINPVLREKLHAAWREARREDMSTLWGFYNILTSWSTHWAVRSSAEDNRAAIQMKRERSIQKVLQNPVFRMAA